MLTKEFPIEPAEVTQVSADPTGSSTSGVVVLTAASGWSCRYYLLLVTAIGVYCGVALFSGRAKRSSLLPFLLFLLFLLLV